MLLSRFFVMMPAQAVLEGLRDNTSACVIMQSNLGPAEGHGLKVLHHADSWILVHVESRCSHYLEELLVTLVWDRPLDTIPLPFRETLCKSVLKTAVLLALSHCQIRAISSSASATPHLK